MHLYLQSNKCINNKYFYIIKSHFDNFYVEKNLSTQSNPRLENAGLIPQQATS